MVILGGEVDESGGEELVAISDDGMKMGYMNLGKIGFS